MKTLEEIECACNKALEEICHNKFEGGIRNLWRYKEIATCRQVYYKIAKEIGYGDSETAHNIGQTSRAAHHARLSINKKLEKENEYTKQVYKKILEALGV